MKKLNKLPLLTILAAALFVSQGALAN
ncbi:MAG TPA: DUF2147 domain-containing protein, partial [Pseudoalteromonas sp.]|nr:DUF2147 domain-containing protein [Pseudoalteromonas sp.]